MDTAANCKAIVETYLAAKSADSDKIRSIRENLRSQYDSLRISMDEVIKGLYNSVEASLLALHESKLEEEIKFHASKVRFYSSEVELMKTHQTLFWLTRLCNQIDFPEVFERTSHLIDSALSEIEKDVRRIIKQRGSK